MLELGFEALRSFPDVVDVFAVAFRATFGRTSRQTAVVAQQLFYRAVIGHRDAARIALECKAAVPAKQERRVTTAVEKNHRLLAAFEARAYRLQETPREYDLLAFGRIFLAH